MSSKLLLIFVLLGLADVIFGYARMVKPLSRGTEHVQKKAQPRRPGPKGPNVYDYHLNCGGYTYQWANQGGQCGVCGDPYEQRQEHIAGGIYATGAISGYYMQGESMKISVDLLDNKGGWMEFRLCPNNDITKPVEQACLDKHLLQMSDGSTRFIVEPNMQFITVKAKLPKDLVCTQCVVQWKYNTGNKYGIDPETQKECMGCGSQEQYYNCADVAIVTSPGHNDTGSTTPVDPDFNKPLPNGNKKNKNGDHKVKGDKVKDENTDNNETTTEEMKPGKVKRTRNRRNPSQLGEQTFDSRNCHASPSWKKNHPGMDAWCQEKCRFGPHEQDVCIPGVCECS